MVYSSYPGRADDRLNIVCLNQSESAPGAIIKLNAAKREDEEVVIDLQRVLGVATENELVEMDGFSDLNFWIYMSSWDLLENSDSVWVRAN